jgi:hypothetical protein
MNAKILGRASECGPREHWRRSMTRLVAWWSKVKELLEQLAKEYGE